MPIFLTIINSAGTKSSMMTSSLTGDTNFPGNLLASGISGFYAELPDGKRLRVDAWSFKAKDLDSYMVGEFDEGVFSLIGAATAAAAPATADSETTAQPVPETAQTSPDAEAPFKPATRKRKK